MVSLSRTDVATIFDSVLRYLCHPQTIILIMSIESAPSTSSLKNTKWDKPEYTLPTPSLAFLFHLECNMESFMHVGNGPHGDRSTVIFKGGRFEGPELRGEILPGGGGDV
jgi:hypothetical protein